MKSPYAKPTPVSSYGIIHTSQSDLTPKSFAFDRIQSSMASCRINSTLRCPSGAPRFSSTCRPHNPRAPLLFINTTLSTSPRNLERVIYFHSPKNFDSLKPLVVTSRNKTHASCCRRFLAPVLSAVALLLWGLIRPPRRNRPHWTECWSVRGLLVLFGCLENMLELERINLEVLNGIFG